MMKIISFVICIAIQSSCYEDVEFQEVRLPKLKYNLRMEDYSRMFPVSDSKPLHIVFEDMYVKTIKCTSSDGNVIYEPNNDNFLNYGTAVLTINEVTSDMSTKWQCVLADINGSITTYVFEIRVKAAKKIDVIIDNTSLNFTITNESLVEYEGINEYSCEEGEMIYLACKNLYVNGSLILKYYNANGTKMGETSEVNSLYFRVLMRAEANRSYVDCTYLTAAGRKDNRQEFTYRITFIIRNETSRNNYFDITINGLNLISKPYQGKGSDIYNYNFIYGENLTITCELKNKRILSDINVGFFNSGHNPIRRKDIENTKSKYTFVVETTHLDRNHMEYSALNPDIKEYLKAVVNFYKESYEGPAIVGLPARDVLYQYSKNNKHWIAHYQYKPYETLRLTCITTTDKALRFYEGDKMITGIKGVNGKIGITYISHIFTLNQNSITCELVDSSKASWKVVLHQKPDSSDKLLEESSNLLVSISCTGSVLFVILLSALFALYWHRRHRITKQKEKPFKKFSENDNSTQGIKNQGNNGEYTYITNEYNYIESEDSVILGNSLYCGSITYGINSGKRDTTYSSHTENYYTEIDNYSRKGIDKVNDKVKLTNAVSYDLDKYENVPSCSHPRYDNL